MNETLFWTIIILSIIISAIIQGWIYAKVFKALKKWLNNRK